VIVEAEQMHPPRWPVLRRTRARARAGRRRPWSDQPLDRYRAAARDDAAAQHLMHLANPPLTPATTLLPTLAQRLSPSPPACSFNVVLQPLAVLHPVEGRVLERSA
jgi:hypothetical protein